MLVESGWQPLLFQILKPRTNRFKATLDGDRRATRSTVIAMLDRLLADGLLDDDGANISLQVNRLTSPADRPYVVCTVVTDEPRALRAILRRRPEAPGPETA